MDSLPSVQVQALTPRDAAAWESYVAGQNSDYPYHTLAARDLIAKTFRHHSQYLMALRDGRVVGALPLFEMRSVVFGRLLVSLPFVTDGGVIADDSDAALKLLIAAQELGERLNVDRVEIRGACKGVEAGPPENWTIRRHKAKLAVDTRRPSDDIFSNLSSRLRGKIRKAERLGATFSVGGSELLNDFYAVFAKNMLNLGTPVYPLSLFENFLAAFADRATVMLVRHQGTAAAGAIGMRAGDSLELPWICSDYDFSRQNTNEFLYWRAICQAADEGLASLELGRSTIDSGPYRFKMHWKPTIEQLEWYLKPIRTTEIKTDADSSRYQAARSIWRKLPLKLANFIGPRVIRYVP